MVNGRVRPQAKSGFYERDYKASRRVDEKWVEVGMVVGKDGWGDGESEAASQVELWLAQVYLKFIKY